jgi:hypothetical protein
MDEFAPVCKFTYMQNNLHMCKFGHENRALEGRFCAQETTLNQPLVIGSACTKPEVSILLVSKIF